MKKIFLGLFSLTLLGLLITPIRDYFQTQESSKETQKKEETLLPKSATNKRDSIQKIVFQNISPKNTNKQNSQKVEILEEALMDYHIDPKDFMKSAQLTKEEAKAFLSTSYKNLKDCLPEGCGQEPDEETGFYDAANTVAVSTMIRMLEIAEANFDEVDTDEWLNQDELLELLDNPSSKLRKLALKTLFNRYPEKSFQKTLTKLEGLKGYEAGDAIEQLIPYLNQENKSSFVDMTKEIIKEGDPFTITEVLSKSEKAVLNQNEIEDIGSQLCVFSREKKTEVAFKSMNYSMGNLAKNSGTRFDLQAFCR